MVRRVHLVPHRDVRFEQSNPTRRIIYFARAVAASSPVNQVSFPTTSILNGVVVWFNLNRGSTVDEGAQVLSCPGPEQHAVYM